MSHNFKIYTVLLIFSLIFLFTEINTSTDTANYTPPDSTISSPDSLSIPNYRVLYDNAFPLNVDADVFVTVEVR